MMTLYYTPHSPYARKVRICAIEKGVMDKINLVLSPPRESTPDLLAANPLSKVPALVTADGLSIYDSPVICEYLDTLSQSRPLLPVDTLARIRVKKMEALADGIMDAFVARFLEGTRPKDQQSPDWLERWLNAIKRSVDVLESGREPLPDGWNLGAISLACALDTIDKRKEVVLSESAPKCAAWLEINRKRDSMIATKP